MILDILVITIFVLFAVQGKSRGFGESVIRLIGVFAGILLGVMFTQPLSKLLCATKLDDSVQTSLRAIFKGQKVNLLDYIPENIGTTLQSIGVKALSVDIKNFSQLAITVFTFLLIVLLVGSLSIFLRCRLRGARQKGTLIGNTDTTAGLLMGMVKGSLFVCLFLAFMFPLAGIFLPDKIQVINEQLNDSYIAGPLYDINPLLSLLKHFSL